MRREWVGRLSRIRRKRVETAAAKSHKGGEGYRAGRNGSCETRIRSAIKLVCGAVYCFRLL